MPSAKDVFFFVLANTLGFLSVGICFVIGIETGVLKISHPDFDVDLFKIRFISGTILTWLFCALLSTAWFFIKGKIRVLFLWAPVVVPFLYGLSVLYASSL